jgi:HD-GYP domain-containing protein (c-di-GMP phosphodiesterase class II)
MREVGLIVRSHHERWDGAGYPDGLAGRQIPLEARIIACCDTWNAMRTDRSYRKALSYEVSFEELRAGSGTQLDPGIAEILMRIVAAEEAQAVAAAHSERSVRHQTVVESRDEPRASSRYDFAA